MTPAPIKYRCSKCESSEPCNCGKVHKLFAGVFKAVGIFMLIYTMLASFMYIVLTNR